MIIAFVNIEPMETSLGKIALTNISFTNTARKEPKVYCLRRAKQESAFSFGLTFICDTSLLFINSQHIYNVIHIKYVITAT